jgi:HD-like signal output (HDOD) protein
LQVARYDPALTARLLATAHYVGSSDGPLVTTLGQAVDTLSDMELRGLCLSVRNWLRKPGERTLDPWASQAIIRHSRFVARGAARLARGNEPLTEDEAFTAGLIHDLGLLAIWFFAPQEADSLWGVIQRRGVSPLLAEEAHGVNHQEVGISLAQHWGLPPQFSEALGCHHNPDAALCHLPLVCAIHLADCLAVEMGWGPYPDRCVCPPEKIALEVLELTPADLADWRDGMDRWAADA